MNLLHGGREVFIAWFRSGKDGSSKLWWSRSYERTHGDGELWNLSGGRELCEKRGGRGVGTGWKWLLCDFLAPLKSWGGLFPWRDFCCVRCAFPVTQKGSRVLELLVSPSLGTGGMSRDWSNVIYMELKGGGESSCCVQI